VVGHIIHHNKDQPPYNPIKNKFKSNI